LFNNSFLTNFAYRLYRQRSAEVNSWEVLGRASPRSDRRQVTC